MALFISFLTLLLPGVFAKAISDQEGCSWELVAHPQIIVPGKESVVFVAPRGCNFTQSSDDLMATLSIWDTTHHKVIHGMVWQVEPDSLPILEPHANPEKGIEVVMVPFRVPSSLPPSRGVLRLHSQKTCHPFVEKQIEDEKCPPKCTTKCIEIPLQLASSIRQILLITDKTHYAKGEQVRLRYQVLDESTMPKKPAELTISISDASGAQLHAWNLGYLQREQGQQDLFEEITFPLGPRSLEGKWIICAQDWPSIIDEDKTSKYCINFHVKERENLQINDVASETKIVEEKVIPQFRLQTDEKFRFGVPFSGKVLSASSGAEEVEVLVKLCQGEKVLDQQTLLINQEDEAVFNFVPIATKAQNLTIEAYLISNIEENPEQLEIDEVHVAPFSAYENRKLDLLATKEIHQEEQIPQRYECPIWTQGLERTFKTGDFAAVTIKVSPLCGCQRHVGLTWAVVRDDQFVSWGQQFPAQDGHDHECVYRFGLEITSRMAPGAIFQAFRPIHNEKQEIVYTYDWQNISVDLEDRTLVILELNTTEVSHSGSLVGVEVFAEPESTICLRGRKNSEETREKQESISDTFGALSSTSRQMIKAFEPVRETWFFQCGTASEDGFYATWIKSPLDGGQWAVEAVSLSPFHGLRMAQSQPLLRTKPIHVQIDGIPATLRRGEILNNLTILTRNNMPIPLQLTVIVSASPGISFFEERHFATYQQNATGYNSIVGQIPMQIKNDADLGKKNVSVLVTAVAFVEGRFVEVDAVHITKELFLAPRGNKVSVSQLDYFCSSAETLTDGTKHGVELSAEQSEVHFSIKAKDEVIFLIEDEANPDLMYKVALGSSQNSVSYLAQITKKGGEQRLVSRNTGLIVSESEERHFWLNWKLDNAHVAQLQLGRGKLQEDEEVIIKWPIPVTFTPSRILMNTPMHQDHVQIRFWQGQQVSDIVSPSTLDKEKGGGHNRIFNTMGLGHSSLNGTTKSQIILSDGFNLPVKSEVDSGTSFRGMMDVLRDAATLSILERLQNIPKGRFTSALTDKMHLVAQDLTYFRNVDGSFGEPMTQQTVGEAMEQLYLMSEIENFYPLSAFLRSGLENWIIKSKDQKSTEILEWAPRDSKVFQQLGEKAHSDILESMLSIRDEEGPLGLLKTPSFARNLALVSLSGNERKLVEEWLSLYLENNNVKCKKQNYKELVYILWAMSNVGRNSKDIFQCVHTHSREILNSPEVGYVVIKALVSAYQKLSSLERLSKTGEQDLKISFATSEDLGHSKTWRMKKGAKISQEEDENEPLIGNLQHVWLQNPMPEKLYFLATGDGCGTVEVETVYETFHVENTESIYLASLESFQEGDSEFLTLCLQMRNGSNSLPTSVSLAYFSGFKFVSLTSSEFWYQDLQQNGDIILHAGKVSESCGTCATLKFQRVSILDHLAPAKLNVYPTRSSPEAKEAFEQFFHLKSLNSSIQDEITWRNTTNKDVQTVEILPEICPCSFKCESEVLDESVENESTTSSLSTFAETSSIGTTLLSSIGTSTTEVITANSQSTKENTTENDIKLASSTTTSATTTTLPKKDE